jgi:hypothetical protein
MRERYTPPSYMRERYTTPSYSYMRSEFTIAGEVNDNSPITFIFEFGQI